MDSNSCRELAVAIPTCNRSAEEFRIGYVLESLAFQQLTEHTFRVFIWDEGPAPVVSDRWVRLLMDLLGERGHQVNYLRRNRSRGVAAARCGLLRNLPSELPMVLLLDDDLLLMPRAAQTLLDAARAAGEFGFLQGSKLELDPQRIYANDINVLNHPSDQRDLVPLYFGDAAFLLVRREALSRVRWDIVTRFQQEGLAGEDVAISLMIADHYPCYGVPVATGYHLSLEKPRWRWEASSDVLQMELLRGVVSDETLKLALPHLADDFDTAGA